MGTFLTTSRMPPELARRVEASVRGVRGVAAPRSAKWRGRIVALTRVLAALALFAIIAAVTLARGRERRDFERSRDSLLETVRAASGRLSGADLAVPARMESWLMESSGGFDGDFVADELRAPGALATTLALPAVYVRGTLAELHTPKGIAEAATTSLKDPLLACLLDPPSSRTEKALLAAVHDVYSGSAEQSSRHVRRLREAEVGLPFLSPLWAENVRLAKSPEEIDALRSEFDKAPIEGATRAAKAALLIFAMDEPGDTGGPTELDGERPHAVRIGLVDLVSTKALLRIRRRVDPAWISATKRPLYAAGIDGCALAFDVRQAVGSKSL